MPGPENVVFYSNEQSANKESKEFPVGPIYPTGFNLVYMHQGLQPYNKYSCDVKGIGPNLYIQHQKVARTVNC